MVVVVYKLDRKLTAASGPAPTSSNKNQSCDLQFCRFFLWPRTFVWGFFAKLEGLAVVSDLPVGAKNGGELAVLAVFEGAKNRVFTPQTCDTGIYLYL